MLAHAQSGDTVFTACLRLFRGYPLAVRRHYAEHRYGSMVLMSRDAGTARYCVLTMERDDLFTIAPWDRRDWAPLRISPGGPVDAAVRWVIMSSVPVLRDGVLLGWVTGQQVRAVLAAHGRVPEPWDDPSGVPGIVVMPRAGSQPAERPPLTAVRLDDWGLWEHVERGQLTDLGPLFSRHPGLAFWVPGAGRDAAGRDDAGPDDAGRGRPGRAAAGRDGGRRTGGRVVVTERLHGDDCWLPAGVYADQWTLSEDATPLTASQLLGLPGVSDLSRRSERPHLIGA